MKNGFTLIELVVVIAIMAVLSGIILFSVTLYINKGKDSNISGNLVILIPAGEVFYNANNNYTGFCGSSILENAILQMPVNVDKGCYDASTNPAGVCCGVAENGQAWAACAPELSNPDSAFCVDSRGVRKKISVDSCKLDITICPLSP